MKRTLLFCTLFGLLPLACSGVARAADKRGLQPVDYTKQVKPLLFRHCVSCHGSLRQRGGLRLDAGSLIRKGGDSGSAVNTVKPDSSPLLHALEGTNDATQMPLDGKPLKKEEISLIRRWIREGAQSPAKEVIAADPRDHWSFKKPVRPSLPKLKDARWVKNPIDAFIAARHRKLGLVPQPAAAKEVLLRRVYIDLIGLPPTPEQLQSFLADDSADAYAQVVNTLLESPRYGERWGRHWMDVWRYSDWYGYRKELRNSARHIWRWRDWIVESLNKDRPYHEMVADMLAADERAPGDAERLRATGFLARHYFKFNRNVWLDSVVEHTGKAFLGMTFNCARCHDHMYDPVSQQEYYRLRAIFEPYRVRTRRIAGQPDTAKDGVPVAYDLDMAVKTYVFERGNDKYPLKDNPVTASVPEIMRSHELKIGAVQLPTAAWYPGFRPDIRRELLQRAESVVKQREAELQAASSQLVAARRKQQEWSRRRANTARGVVRAARPRSAARTTGESPPLLFDTFAKSRSELWKIGAGTWNYRDGKLVQSQVADTRQWIRSTQSLPRDFTARFRFRTTGGAQYKSVGLSFDDDAKGHAESVYLSAYARGPKIQVAHVRGGKSSYPPSGAKRLPIRVGKVYEMRIDVRDRLINVFVDGKLQLVYQLPGARSAGKLSLWTYDATAEFQSIRVAPLRSNAKLAGGQPAAAKSRGEIDPAAAVASSMQNLKVATAALKAARSSLASLNARIRADNARYASRPSADVKSLIANAVRFERLATLHQAEADLAAARQTRLRADRPAAGGTAKSRMAAMKAEAAATKKLAAARIGLTKPATDYSPLTPTYPTTSSGRRLALSGWVADRNNPLTARVAVNHIWMRHFGEPLVPTVFDFGRNGKPASHPRLLDWLAVEFMDAGWSMKHLHRIIVSSNAYRMSSTTRGTAAKNLQVDPDNKSLWRMNTIRLESEIVRDSVLHVSGALDLKTGGPELDEKSGQTTYRRSIYYRHAPEKFMTFLQIFDSASTNECYRRNETVIPQQALALVNSSLSLAQSRNLATLIQRRIRLERRTVTDDSFITALFLSTLCRNATSRERVACVEFLKNQSMRLSKSRNLTKIVGGPEIAVKPSVDPKLRARENLAHVLLNHHEFVTRR